MWFNSHLPHQDWVQRSESKSCIGRLVVHLVYSGVLIQWLECLSDKQNVDGSIPSRTTTRKKTMDHCKVCSKEVPEGKYYCGIDCYAVVSPAVKALIDFTNKRASEQPVQPKEIKMDTNKVGNGIKIGGAVFCVVVFVLAIVMLVRPPVTSGPTIDQQNEVNHTR